MACVVRTAGERIRRLSEGWELVELAAGAATTPHDLERLRPRCVPAIVPGTVGQALYGSAATSLAARADLDELDFWYRTRFAGPRGRARLRFGGLATLADVFLNGQLLFQANDLFSTYEHEVTGLCKGDDELAIRFRALRSEPRGTRPRYKARFVEDQSLRRVRTTLFGRMPGFTPMLPPVGPYRAIELVESAELVVTAADVRARVCGDGGVVAATLVVEGSSRVAGTLRVGDAETALRASPASGTSAMLSGQIALAHVDRWWPHTHGTQPLYPVCATLELDGRAIEVDLGRTGFREIELRTDDGGFAISVNGVPVFCRGACWLPLDPLSLDGSADDLEGTLALARQSGMNMLRAVANGVYPEQRFYELCEELGILI